MEDDIKNPSKHIFTVLAELFKPLPERFKVGDKNKVTQIPDSCATVHVEEEVTEVDTEVEK